MRGTGKSVGRVLDSGLPVWSAAGGEGPAAVLGSAAVLGRAGRVHLSRDGDGTIWVAGGTVICMTGEVEL